MSIPSVSLRRLAAVLSLFVLAACVSQETRTATDFGLSVGDVAKLAEHAPGDWEWLVEQGDEKKVELVVEFDLPEATKKEAVPHFGPKEAMPVTAYRAGEKVDTLLGFMERRGWSDKREFEDARRTWGFLIDTVVRGYSPDFDFVRWQEETHLTDRLQGNGLLAYRYAERDGVAIGYIHYVHFVSVIVTVNGACKADLERTFAAGKLGGDGICGGVFD